MNIVRRLAPWCAAAVSGCLVFLAFPNWNLGLLAWVALAPLWWCCERATARRAFLLGWLTGFVTNVGGFYWVYVVTRDFGYMPVSVSVLAVVLVALQQGVVYGLGAGVARWLTQRTPDARVLAYPAGLLLFEALVPMIFPWRIGHSQWLLHVPAQLAEWGGLGLVGLVVLFGSSALACVGDRARWTTLVRRQLVAGAVVVVGLLGAGGVRLHQIDERIERAPSLRVGLVEADVGIYEKADPRALQNNLLTHQRLSAELAEQGAELIVWPETAYQPAEPTPRARRRYYLSRQEASSPEQARMFSSISPALWRDTTWLPRSEAPLVDDYQDDVRANAQTRDVVAPQRGFEVPLLFGSLMWSEVTDEQRRTSPVPLERDQGVSIHNSAVLLDADGQVLGVYDKNLRMPISEQVPFARQMDAWFGFNIYDAVPVAGEFYRGVPGDGMELPRSDGRGSWRLGVTICYEGIMAGHHRAVHAQRPDLLVNITNDAWFGKTAEPYLHLALATFRTIEQRTAMARSTNTGVSAFVDPAGRVVAETSLEGAETLLRDLPMLRATTTLYMKFGDWPTWGAALFLLAVAVAGRTSARTEPSDEA